MANLPLKKTDLKGPVYVGQGWISVSGWASKVGDDQRLTSVETLNAAFSGLDVEEIPQEIVDKLRNMTSLQGFDMGEGYQRTSVLVDTDGSLTRVYRDSSCGETICLDERYLTILGNPPEVFCVSPYVYACPAGVLAESTNECPDWAKDLLWK